MNSKVVKFIDYLKSHKQKNITFILQNRNTKQYESYFLDLADEICVIDNFIRILSIKKEDWSKYSEISLDFDEISKYLISSPLNIKEQLYIIMLFIEKNIATGLLDQEQQIIDFRKGNNNTFEKDTYEEVKEFARKKEFKILQQREEEDLSNEDKLMLFEIEKCIKTCKIDSDEIVESHKRIKEHYLDKKNSYNEEDVKILVDTLTELKVVHSLTENIEKLLLDNIKKKEKQQVNISLFKVISNDKKEVLSKKEYYELLQEVKKYFDIENKSTNKYITTYDKITLINLLKRLDYNEDKIKEILRIIDKENKNYKDDKNNSVDKYIELYNKIKYYSDKGYCVEEFKELEDYFNEIMNNNENSEFWQQALEEVLDKIIETIPNDYDYELEVAKTYMKK